MALGKLKWRASFIAEKLSGRLPNVPWSLVLDMVGASHPATRPLPVVEVVEEDPAARMLRVRVGDQETWYPGEAAREGLDLVYSEVFDPAGGHFYEYRGAALSPGDIVCDAGACEGYFTRYALDRGARVLAVEPWSRMAEALERTFAAEIADGRLKIARVLLGDTEGSAELEVSLSLPFAAQNAAGGQWWEVRETVPVVRLDRLLPELGWDRLDFLKMDIEGGERAALRGAENLIRKHRPRLSVTTYHRADDWRVLRSQVEAAAPRYRYSYKGLVSYPEGGQRPVMLHAWPGERENRA